MQVLRGSLFAAMLLSSAAANALVMPVPDSQDPRVVTLVYSPHTVAQLYAAGDAPLMVVLQDGETPVTTFGLNTTEKLEVASQCGGCWLVKQIGSTIMIKPYKSPDSTMATVLTVGPDGGQRIYQFKLDDRPGQITDIRSGGMMSVQMTYRAPADPVAAMQAASNRQKVTEAAEAVEVKQALRAPVSAAAFNIAYQKLGDATCPSLAPVYMWDDGNRTTLFFANNTAVPEIYIMGLGKGDRSITTPIPESTPTGVSVVIPSVNAHYRLVRNRIACDIFNKAPLGYGQPLGNGSGTISPNVLREARR